jgi:O-antigen biosynthesis protein
VDERPLVGIVVVNYNGGDLTIRCLESLHRLTYPRECTRIVLVDNGSNDRVVARVRREFPGVDVVETGRNLGFGGGCNRGFERLPDVDYVALINNDAVAEPGWLDPLVNALEGDPTLGAAAPKVLLRGFYHELVLSTKGTRVEVDPRLLGVQVGQVCVGDQDVTAEVEWAAGFWAPESSRTGLHHYRWTMDRATMLVPTRHVAPITIELAIPGGATRTVTIESGAVTAQVNVGAYERVTLEPTGPGSRVINNAGAVVLEDFSLADRGFLEVDIGQYDREEDVEAWSGAAVVLRRTYIDDVGRFDEPFFLYYEDADLSWRGRNRGWRYRYIPTSLVEHEHSASARSMGSLVRHLSARNRLVMLTKVAPAPVARRAWLSFLREVAATYARDVILRAVSGRWPVTAHAFAMSRVMLGALRLAPRAIILRRAARGSRR